MFRESIDRPIDPIPRSYVTSIKRPYNEPDYSLTCLGIALLRPRMEQYCGIGGGWWIATEENTAVDSFLSDINRNEEEECPRFYYYAYRVSSDKEMIKRKLNEKGFKIKENIGDLLMSKANVECIAAYHETKNIAAIFVNNRDIRYYHMLISFLKLLFPTLFKDKDMTEEDYNLVKALSKTDKNVFIQRIQESLKPYVMEFRREMLENLLKSMHEVKVQNAANDVSQQRNRIREVEAEFSRAVEYLNQLIVTYEGMKATENYGKPEEELVEYLSTKEEIHNLEVDGNNLKFTVATLLNNYDADTWATFARQGYIFDGNYRDRSGEVRLLSIFNDKNNRKILLNNIFCESPEFAVKIAGNYVMNLSNCHLTTSRSYDYADADPVFADCIPNPHIKNFACLGGYEDKVAHELMERNYIGAIELCCASAGSVNLSETEQNFRPFIGWILSTRGKVLHRKDGVDMSPEEALVYLIDKENKE